MAGEPVRNDLFEGHCGQTSQHIILIQDVYSQKRGHIKWAFLHYEENTNGPLREIVNNNLRL